MNYNDLSDVIKSKIKTVRLTELNQVIQIFTEQRWDDRIQRARSSYFYRGLSNADFTLTTTLQRNCKGKSQTLEKTILRNFGKCAIFIDPQIQESIWRQMILGQHHGLPTRLIDWSYSPLVGLHFAVSENNPDDFNKHDCAIWRLNCHDVHKRIPAEYHKVLEDEYAFLFTADMLAKVAKDIDDYDKSMKKTDSFVILEPLSIDERIVNQYSFFTVTPSHITCMEEYIADYLPDSVRYVIDKNLRWRIRDMLDQLNINERIIYPGFDGIAAWLKRYYYVK